MKDRRDVDAPELLLALWRRQTRAWAWRRKRIQGCWWRWRSFNSTKVKREGGVAALGCRIKQREGKARCVASGGEGRARGVRAGSVAGAGQGQGLAWLPETPCLLQDIITIIICKYCLCGQKERAPK